MSFRVFEYFVRGIAYSEPQVSVRILAYFFRGVTDLGTQVSFRTRCSLFSYGGADLGPQVSFRMRSLLFLRGVADLRRVRFLFTGCTPSEFPDDMFAFSYGASLIWAPSEFPDDVFAFASRNIADLGPQVSFRMTCVSFLKERH